MTQGQDEPVVIDTNVLFSALISRNSSFSQLIFVSTRDFLICETTLAELFRHKEKLIRRSRMGEAEVVDAYHLLLKRIEVYKEDRIPSACWTRARHLCAGLDPDDEPQVALALAVDGLLWTGDKVLRTGLAERGFDRFFAI